MPAGRKSIFVLTLVIFFLVFFGQPLSMQAAGNEEAFRQVVMIVLDKVALDDLTSYGGERLQGIIDGGAAALLNTSTADGGGSESSYLTIGAGSRGTAGFEAGLAFNREEAHEGIEVGKLYYRHRGIKPTEAEVLHPYVESLARQNKHHRYYFQAGYLGEALKSAGYDRAVIGNADTEVPRRMAVAIAMDSEGKVPMGSVGEEVIKKSPDFPFGIRSDGDAYLHVWQKVQDKASLVVIDWGDTARIDLYSHHLSPGRRQELLAQSMAELEVLLENMEERPGRLLLLLTPSPSRFHGYGNRALTPVIMAGSELEEGLLTSTATRRTGLIANLNLAPLVLSYLEEVSAASLPQVVAEANGQEKMEFLKEMEIKSFQVYQQRPAIIQGYIFLQILFLFAGLFGLVFRYRPARWLRFPLKVLLLVPLVLLLLAPLAFFPFANVYYSGLLVVLAALALTGAIVLFPLQERACLAFIGLTTTFFILLDLYRGSPWMRMGFLGFDPISGARFYGIGNEYMGALIGAAILGTSFLLSILDHKKAGIYLPFCLLLFFLVIFFMAAPSYGANLGGTITAAASFGFTASLYYRVVGWKRYYLIPAFSLCAAGMLLLWLNIISRPVAASHISQTWDLVTGEKAGQFWLIVQRKLSMNWRLIKYSFWSRALLTFMILAAVLVFRPAGLVQKILSRDAFLRTGLAGGMLAGVTAFLVNDSGVVAASTVLLFSIVPLLLLGLEEAFLLEN